MCNVRAVNSAFVSSFFISSFGANSFEGLTFNSDLRLSQSYYKYIYIYTRNAEFPLTDLVPSFSWSFRSLLWMDSASGAPGCSMAAVSIVTHAEIITPVPVAGCLHVVWPLLPPPTSWASGKPLSLGRNPSPSII